MFYNVGFTRWFTRAEAPIIFTNKIYIYCYHASSLLTVLILIMNSANSHTIREFFELYSNDYNPPIYYRGL